MVTQKQKIIIILAVVLCMVFSSIFAANITHFAPQYAKTTANVNLRKMPTTSSDSYVKTLSKDTNVKLVGTIDDYYIVQTANNEVGVVSKDYINTTGESFYSDVYTDYAPFYTTINADNVIVRGGPSTKYQMYGKVSTGDRVYVIGAINDFLMVITDKNLVGMVRQDFVVPPSQEDLDKNEDVIQQDNPNANSNSNTNENDNNNSNGNTQNNVENVDNNTIPNEEVTIYTVLDRINTVRAENGLPPLEIDDLVTSVAQAKAKDMVTQKYFSHKSPTYGTPFEQLSGAGVKYKTAGENIAGNNNIMDAIDSFFNSESHSKNMLSNAYNYIGIGIEKSDIYGYVVVLMFIGR